jgi:broad specificity phosphatase PhoE
MESGSQQLFLIRHGETEWSRTGRHTGRTDVPLTEEGKVRAKLLSAVLNGRKLVVWTSPLQRAAVTCRLAGFDAAEVDYDLREWDYGIYEGRTTAEIRKEKPDWSVWLSPIENGESLDEVADRARRVINRVVAATDGDAALFAHGHILRILAACWIALPPVTGRFLGLDTASVSALGYERQTRVIRFWNLVPRAEILAR